MSDFDAYMEELDGRNGDGPRRFQAVRADPTRMRPQRWLWEQFPVHGALNLETGDEKIGKSTLQAHIATRVTTGKLPGTFYGEPLDVLFIGTDEDSWESVV